MYLQPYVYLSKCATTIYIGDLPQPQHYGAAKGDFKDPGSINMDIQERAFATINRSAFFTLKDHKGNFSTNPSVRVLNPTKPEIGRSERKLLNKLSAKLNKLQS